jgi:hypothetical protein
MQASASKRVTGSVRHAGNMPRSNRQCDVLAICQIVFPTLLIAEAGITQDMLADAVGVSFQQVPKDEKGTNITTEGISVGGNARSTCAILCDGLSERRKKRDSSNSGLRFVFTGPRPRVRTKH